LAGNWHVQEAKTRLSELIEDRIETTFSNRLLPVDAPTA